MSTIEHEIYLQRARNKAILKESKRNTKIIEERINMYEKHINSLNSAGMKYAEEFQVMAAYQSSLVELKHVLCLMKGKK